MSFILHVERTARAFEKRRVRIRVLETLVTAREFTRVTLFTSGAQRLEIHVSLVSRNGAQTTRVCVRRVQDARECENE